MTCFPIIWSRAESSLMRFSVITLKAISQQAPKLLFNTTLAEQSRYSIHCRAHTVNTLRPRQNGSHFAADTFKCIFLKENFRISIKISLKFVPKSSIDNIPTLFQITAWRQPGSNDGKFTDAYMHRSASMSWATADDHPKNFSPTWPSSKPSLMALIMPLRPHCAQPIWCYSAEPIMSNFLKISSDMENDFRNGLFSTFHITLKIESNF